MFEQFHNKEIKKFSPPPPPVDVAELLLKPYGMEIKGFLHNHTQKIPKGLRHILKRGNGGGEKEIPPLISALLSVTELDYTDLQRTEHICTNCSPLMCLLQFSSGEAMNKNNKRSLLLTPFSSFLQQSTTKGRRKK